MSINPNTSPVDPLAALDADHRGYADQVRGVLQRDIGITPADADYFHVARGIVQHLIGTCGDATASEVGTEAPEMAVGYGIKRFLESTGRPQTRMAGPRHQVRSYDVVCLSPDVVWTVVEVSAEISGGMGRLIVSRIVTPPGGQPVVGRASCLLDRAAAGNMEYQVVQSTGIGLADPGLTSLN